MEKSSKKQHKKILITGVAGFIGSHLADYAIQHQWRVSGIKRNHESMTHNASDANKIKLFSGDVTKQKFVTSVLSREQPDIIFHLASLITPRNEGRTKKTVLTPEKILLANLQMARSLLESVRMLKARSGYNPVIMLVGSAEEYGKISPKHLPIRESVPLRPITHYAASKVLQELLGETYTKTYGLKTVLVRLFNQHGPRQQQTIVPAAFAKQIALIEAGLQEPVIYHGNLNAKRDFTDVRDTVRALVMLAHKATHNKHILGKAFNIASGKKHFYSIKQILTMLLAMSRMPIQTRIDPKRMRKAEIQAVLGSYQRLHAATGWRPRISIAKTLRNSLNYWREQSKNPR